MSLLVNNLSYGFMEASLTQQGYKHDTGQIVGYVEFLKKDFLNVINTSSDKIIRFAYGGNRISDAGLIRLSEIIEKKPDICVIEPLIEDGSRGKPILESEAEYIYTKLISRGIVPVTFMVFLPVNSQINSFPNYRVINAICNKYSLPIFIANIKLIEDSGGSFNRVHTNPSSGKKLAEQLAFFLANLPFVKLKKHCSSLKLPDLKVFPYKIGIIPTHTYKKIGLTIEPSGSEPFYIKVIQKQEVGIYSPIIKVCISKSCDESTVLVEEKLSIWDPYCHYSRASYVTLCNVDNLSGNILVDISISDSIPDYSKCRRDGVVWPNKSELKLFPKGEIYVFSNKELNGYIKYFS